MGTFNPCMVFAPLVWLATGQELWAYLPGVVENRRWKRRLSSQTKRVQEGSDSTQIPSAHEAGQRARVATATFGEIVPMLSFSPVFKHMSLADLEWLVIPALATNQVTVVRGKPKGQNGLLVPIGLALWAHVSEVVDNKLEAQQ